MRKYAARWALVTLVVLVVSPSSYAAELPHGRVSYDGGGGLVKGVGEVDWSNLTLNSMVLAGDEMWVEEQGTIEVEMAGGNFLRIGDISNVEIVSLPRSAYLRGWLGAFYVQRLRLSSGRLVFETPLCQVSIDQHSLVRVDILEDGYTIVTVRQGSATISSPNDRDMRVEMDQKVYIEPGYLPSLPVAFDPYLGDGFDQWNLERALFLAKAADSIPADVGMKEYVVGAEDLSMYGDWQEVDSEYCWRPRVDDGFVPYRDGYWSYVRGCGYVWVGSYPFSYITSHYGRWMYDPEAGWFWVYRDGWAPAWVASLRCGQSFVWCPLDLAGNPVNIAMDCFAVGGLNFGIYATTCCLADDLLIGRCKPYPCLPAFAEQISILQPRDLEHLHQ